MRNDTEDPMTDHDEDQFTLRDDELDAAIGGAGVSDSVARVHDRSPGMLFHEAAGRVLGQALGNTKKT